MTVILVDLDFINAEMVKEALPMMKKSKSDTEEILYNRFNNKVLFNALVSFQLYLKYLTVKFRILIIIFHVAECSCSVQKIQAIENIEQTMIILLFLLNIFFLRTRQLNCINARVISLFFLYLRIL